MSADVVALPTAESEEDGLLTSAEVCAATEATYRQLDWWQRVGYIGADQPSLPKDAVEPSGRKPGSGHPRRWHPDEVVVIRRMVSLTRVGLHPRTAAYAARNGYETWLSDEVKVTVVDR